MRILVFGASGMLGHKIMLKFAKKYDILGTLRKPNDRLAVLLKNTRASLEPGVDAFDDDSLRRVIKSFKPDAVINCIGIVKQLKEANDPYVSISINALLPHRLEIFSQEFGFRLIHLSTDCVFSGNNGPYVEGDLSDVSDLYGQTKHLGEVSGKHSLTLRTSIVGRELDEPYTGLFEWFLAQNGKPSVKGYKYALYTGLTTNHMADVIEHILFKNDALRGLYHLSSNEISKLDLLNMLKAEARIDVNILPDNEFHCDRRLDSTRFRNETGWHPPLWQEMIHDMMDEDRDLYGIIDHPRI